MCFDPLGKAREECTEVSSLPKMSVQGTGLKSQGLVANA